MSRRSDMLELAILGLLQDTEMHGYELRKEVHRVLGPVRALSYGTLYPRLRLMVDRGHLMEVDRPVAGRRARITYAVTPAGREYFESLLTSAGPSAWEDDALRCTLPSLAAPTEPCACESCRVVARGWRSGWSKCGPMARRGLAALLKTTTSPSCTGMVWNPPKPIFVGSPA
ncbi:PadR family transcriptional regulator [Ornithinimicrobium sp. INDO-MA30-4]|uniref:PadR family transcriptional regulator n=1 Tax=Ornithinimicrobium sp. INDO-MA30-4 TaxID=2908651 RepID=UPI001F4925DE|nr:PadR family transcriptional regulator [Ornithinimicrobium sp. INDO-MA30-4]UJH70079.1 PadR family transcriptional regulator [Ornithinimicrobium sp. INDO-MA30-4]